MIDNLDDADARIIMANGRQGPWHSFNDSNGGNIQPPLGTGFLPVAGGANNTSHAVHTTGSGYQFGGVGFDLNNTTTTPESAQSQPYNASAYNGITFWAKGSGTLRVEFAQRSFVPTDRGGSCTTNCWNVYGANTPTLTSTWTADHDQLRGHAARAGRHQPRVQPVGADGRLVQGPGAPSTSGSTRWRSRARAARPAQPGPRGAAARPAAPARPAPPARPGAAAPPAQRARPAPPGRRAARARPAPAATSRCRPRSPAAARTAGRRATGIAASRPAAGPATPAAARRSRAATCRTRRCRRYTRPERLRERRQRVHVLERRPLAGRPQPVLRLRRRHRAATTRAGAATSCSSPAAVTTAQQQLAERQDDDRPGHQQRRRRGRSVRPADPGRRRRRPQRLREPVGRGQQRSRRAVRRLPGRLQRQHELRPAEVPDRSSATSPTCWRAATGSSAGSTPPTTRT